MSATKMKDRNRRDDKPLIKLARDERDERKYGHNTMHPGPRITRQSDLVRQATIQKAQPYLDHV